MDRVVDAILQKTLPRTQDQHVLCPITARCKASARACLHKSQGRRPITNYQRPWTRFLSLYSSYPSRSSLTTLQVGLFHVRANLCEQAEMHTYRGTERLHRNERRARLEVGMRALFSRNPRLFCRSLRIETGCFNRAEEEQEQVNANQGSAVQFLMTELSESSPSHVC